MDAIAQQSGDSTLVNVLSGQQIPGLSLTQGLTVFVPVNEAFSLVPSDSDQLRNDIMNFIVKDTLTVDRILNMNGQNIKRTFGYKPNLMVRVVQNPYYNQRSNSASTSQVNQQQAAADTRVNMPPNPMMMNQQQMAGIQKRKRQNTPSPVQQAPFPTNQPIGIPGGQPYTNSDMPLNQQQQLQYNSNQQQQQQQIPNRDFAAVEMNNGQFPNQVMAAVNPDGSVYEQYVSMFGSNQGGYDDLGISNKLPRDQLFLLNAAVILDTFQCTNGIVYLLKSYPRYYDKSLLMLLNDGDVNGLAQNLNFWITRAARAFRDGHENLRNALNAFGPNTYFLPSDQAFNTFSNREQLNNGSFLFDILFRSHRVSNRLLFDYYLDDPSPTVKTDTGLPVSTRHKRINGQDDIEISIGHVKGRILPGFRNIYCATGVIHLVDSVLGVPSRSAYQEIASNQELSIFRSVIDRSARFRQLLDQAPAFQFSTNNQNFNQMYNNPQRIQRQQKPLNDPRPSRRQVTPLYNPLIQQQQQQPLQQQLTNEQFNPMQQQILYNNFAGNFQYVTVLAPRDASLLAVRDTLLSNDSAIDQFISNHIIIDNQGGTSVFYTDHDANVFKNGQTYSTFNPNLVLSATVTQNPNMPSNGKLKTNQFHIIYKVK